MPPQPMQPLYSTLSGEAELAELVDLFVAELPLRVTDLRQAWAVGDRELLRRLAHQLKGAGGSYGFPAVTTWAAQLEAAIRHEGDEATVRRCLEELIATCVCCRAAADA